MTDPKKCSVCQEKPIKYTCPRCSRRTCSLACCLSHKKTWNCNGQRDKTSFKSMDTMTDLDLLSDYRFLEEVQREVEASQRDQLSNQMKSFNETTRFQKLIQNKLKKLAGIRILYLPKFSSRHKQNQMWLSRRSEAIFWHIECRFFVDTSFHIWSIARLPTAETSLVHLLTKFRNHLCEKYSIDEANLNETIHPDLLLLKSKEFFQNKELSVYTENFGQQRKQRGHYEKSSSFQTMVDLFRDRVFIEYPILFICLHEDEIRMNEYLSRK